MIPIKTKYAIWRFLVFFICCFAFYIFTPVAVILLAFVVKFIFHARYPFGMMYVTVLSVNFLINAVLYLRWLSTVEHAIKMDFVLAVSACLLFYLLMYFLEPVIATLTSISFS